MAAAKLLGKRTHQIPGRLNVSEIFFEVPKDHANPSHGSLRLFARSVERFENPVDASKKEVKQPPWFLYLQGGPGMGCRSPQNYAWTDVVLDKGYQVCLVYQVKEKILMKTDPVPRSAWYEQSTHSDTPCTKELSRYDIQGTGLSSTVTARTLATEGGPAQQAAFLKHFRADSIVKDCEAVRKTLTADFPESKKKWSAMGQSFGGFCCVTYLSQFPEGLREVFTLGGLPPLVSHPDYVYEKLFSKVAERNRAYYRKYGEDIRRVKDLIRYISKEPVMLPSGGKLSVLRLRQLGMCFGFHGFMDSVHEIICRFTSDLNQFGFFTRPSLAAFENMLPFDTMPLYALVHEPCYARRRASNWSADRVMKQIPEFMNVSPDDPHPIFFTGEMVFRDMFKDYDELRILQQTADHLATADDWPELYDEDRLRKNEVPVYSATYMEDMYVHFDFARETASKIRNCKNFITNVLYHDALNHKTDEVMKQLFALRDDTID